MRKDSDGQRTHREYTSAENCGRDFGYGPEDYAGFHKRDGFCVGEVIAVETLRDMFCF
jgi:hypothetical protein